MNYEQMRALLQVQKEYREGNNIAREVVDILLDKYQEQYDMANKAQLHLIVLDTIEYCMAISFRDIVKTLPKKRADELIEGFMKTLATKAAKLQRIIEELEDE